MPVQMNTILKALSLLLPLLLGLLASCASEQPTVSALQPLQGTWEGFGLGRKTPNGPYVKSDGTITITITGESLTFHRDEDFWFETTFTLPAVSGPQQLHATITRCSPPEDSIGKVVIAFFKIEDGTLTLAGIRDQDSTQEWPQDFAAMEDTMTGRYELRKIE